MRSRLIVAIDGPAGAGKTTVTRRVAEELGYTLVDTGALYRTVALAAERDGIAWDDPARLGVLAQELAVRSRIRLDGQQVWLDGADVTLAIRMPAISQGASKVSSFGEVRRALLELQRELGREGGVVLEGRDIGTVVFPEAEAKFFLTASSDVRARRRYDELKARGVDADLDEVRREVMARDQRDTERNVAPLRQAENAELVDSSELGVEEVVDRIVARVRKLESAAERPRA